MQFFSGGGKSAFIVRFKRQYPRFRRRCGQHRAYRKLRLRNSRPTVKFSTSSVEKPGQRSRLSSRKCSISLPLSEEYVWTTSSKRSWRVVMHPSCSNAENHWKRMHSKLQFPRCYRQLFFFARRSDSSRVRGSTSVFSRAQRKLVRDHWSHASPGRNSTSSVAQRQSPWRNSTSHGFKRLIGCACFLRERIEQKSKLVVLQIYFRFICLPGNLYRLFSHNVVTMETSAIGWPPWLITYWYLWIFEQLYMHMHLELTWFLQIQSIKM